jgi:8-oxo-dGTP pyrophosphatase MutT (NUDIX family)
MPSSPRPWERLESERAQNLHLFQPRWDLMVNPRTGERMRRLVLETRDWVNVVARTVEGRYLFVRQYRFGSERVTTEVPGGVIDPGEEPLDAARRELREETGYEAESWRSLGSVAPNPAVQDNRCHHFLAEGARRVGELELDEGEDLVVTSLSEAEVRAAVAGGEIDHALVLTALCRVLDLRADDPA